jgi:hypothetical protein
MALRIDSRLATCSWSACPDILIIDEFSHAGRAAVGVGAMMYNGGVLSKETNMRRIFVFSFAVTLFLLTKISAQGPAVAKGTAATSPEAQEKAARYAAADIRVLVPGVVYNAGLLDLADAYTKQTGKKVGVSLVGMGSIVNAVKTANPPADVITLPFE